MPASDHCQLVFFRVALTFCVVLPCSLITTWLYVYCFSVDICIFLFDILVIALIDAELIVLPLNIADANPIDI